MAADKTQIKSKEDIIRRFHECKVEAQIHLQRDRTGKAKAEDENFGKAVCLGIEAGLLEKELPKNY